MADSNKHTPSLRFPEFNSAPGWIILPIGEVADTFSGGTPYVGNSDFYGGTIPFIRSGEIACEKTAISLTEYGLSNSAAKMIKKGTLLYALYGATSGNVAISKIDGAINQAILAIIPKDDKYNNYFVYYFLEYQKPSVLSKYLQGGQGNLSAAIINSIPIAIPCNCDGTISCDEQAKVVDILLSLDSLIAATKSKLEQLKEHKRGLMQRLFPAKGKTVPELRFPEFRDDAEWEEHSFSDICTFIPNNTLSRANLNNENGSVQNIHYGDVLIRFRECLNVQNERLPFISNVQDIDRYYKVKLVNGDVIIADTAEDETVGKCTELVGHTNEIIVSGLHTIAIRPNKIFATGYLGFYMNSNSYREQLTQIMQGVKVLSISKTAISQTKIHFPSSISEQGKIAHSLSSINDVIKSYEDKITALELHKKGLMQQLFPKL